MKEMSYRKHADGIAASSGGKGWRRSRKEEPTAAVVIVVQKSRAPRQRDGDIQWFFSAKAFRPGMIYI